MTKYYTQTHHKEKNYVHKNERFLIYLSIMYFFLSKKIESLLTKYVDHCLKKNNRIIKSFEFISVMRNFIHNLCEIKLK